MRYVAFVRTGFACLGMLGGCGSASWAQDAPSAPASPSPERADAVPPAISRQLQAIFESLRKEAEAYERETVAYKTFLDVKTADLVKKLREPGTDTKALEAAHAAALAQVEAKWEKASQAFLRKKDQALRKAGKTGATEAQIEIEWSRWLEGVRSGLKP